MRKYLLTVALVSMLFACKDKEAEMKQQAELKSLREHDSLLGLKSQSQDSTITAYIKSFNDIQDNMDSIKRKAKIMTVNSGTPEGSDKKAAIIADMRYISDMMTKNKAELSSMKKKLAASGARNEMLEKMVAHLSDQITEKDAEIDALQSQLAETNANLKIEIRKFNDSMKVISTQHQIIAEQNTVYYAIGTSKELKNKGVIMKEGGVLGVGGTEALKPNTNTAYFTSANLYNVKSLPLFSKLDKIITNHPTVSYTIHGDKTADSLIITNQKLFWSESKFLVIVVKQR